MEKLICLLTVCVFIAAGASCAGSSRSSDKAADTAEPAIAAIDSLDACQLIAWKASQGMAMYPGEIDTIVAYFAEADRWTGEQLTGVRTREQFDTVESRYLQRFPYIDIFSMVLEQYASQISEEQMDKLQAIALSLGDKVDRAAKAAGIDTEEAKAAARIADM